jgi:hypothetical protein
MHKKVLWVKAEVEVQGPKNMVRCGAIASSRTLVSVPWVSEFEDESARTYVPISLPCVGADAVDSGTYDIQVDTLVLA